VLKGDYVRLFGADIIFRSWTSPGDLSAFAYILPLLAWGYQRDCLLWYALLDRLEGQGLAVFNPVSVLRWNSDKTYLAQLATYSVATVPTRIVDALDEAALATARIEFGTDILVIKPPISGGADNTFRLGNADALPLPVVGRRMMIQPFLTNITAEGEFSLFYFNGIFSHAIIKRPAIGDFRVQDQFGGYEASVVAPPGARALAVAALAATNQITGCGTLAYARVDMLRDDRGAFRLMELELIEPSLFLQFAADKGTVFAAAMTNRIKLSGSPQ
jgi:glutathione synthase/RimK-type ligase-like ATP-grasp enzyme